MEQQQQGVEVEAAAAASPPDAEAGLQSAAVVLNPSLSLALPPRLPTLQDDMSYDAVLYTACGYDTPLDAPGITACVAAPRLAAVTDSYWTCR